MNELQICLCYQYTLTKTDAMEFGQRSPPSPVHKCLLRTLLLSHLYLQSNLLALDTSNDNIGCILGNDFVVVQHLEF